MADDFASMFENSTQSAGRRQASLEAGQLIEGTVLAISAGLVVVDIGTMADATIDLLEFEGRSIQVGDKIRATVSNPRKDGPLLTLSLGKGGSAINSSQLEMAMAGRTPVTGTVSASNKGGFSVDVAGLRAFCPISQIDAGFVTDPQIFVGQTLDFLVTEIREGGRNVVLSRRKLLQDERRAAEDQLVQSLKTGETVTGTVKKLVPQGAVIDLGGAEGFIPISELSSGRVAKPDDVVAVGETVQAQVLSIDRNEKGLSLRLSLKALNATSEPSAPAAQVDEILEGKIIKHVMGGLIITTGKGEGLVPTRELSLAPGADHRRAYPVDTTIQVVVVSRDPTNGKLRFSVDRVAQVQERNNYKEFGSVKKGEGSRKFGSLGDLMAGKWGGLSAAAAPVPHKTGPAHDSRSPEPKSNGVVRRK
jgi:small subunit ribosomal protein S1